MFGTTADLSKLEFSKMKFVLVERGNSPRPTGLLASCGDDAHGQRLHLILARIAAAVSIDRILIAFWCRNLAMYNSERLPL